MIEISPRLLEDVIQLHEAGLLNGSFHTISDEVYHNKLCPGISSSVLKNYLNYSPRKARWLQDHQKTTDAMVMGSAVHLLTFQPEEFSKQFAVVPEGMRRDMRSKDYQAFVATTAGKRVLTNSEFERAKEYADAVKAHPKVAQILEVGMFERSIFWEDVDTGMLLKCKPDCVTADGMLFDLKTTTSANQFIWGANAIKLGYDLSAAMYIDGVNAAGMLADAMHFIVLEKNPPFEIAIRHFPAEFIELGRRKYKHALQILKECQINGVFPAYPEESEPVLVPAWAINWSEDNAITFDEGNEDE